MRSPPVRFFSSLMVSTDSGAAPAMKPLMKRRSIFRNSSLLSRPMKMVGTPGMNSGLYFFSSSMITDGSGLGTRTSVHPPQTVKFWMPVNPAEWKNGKMAMMLPWPSMTS